MLEYYQIFNVDTVQKDEAAIIQVLMDIKNKKLSNDLTLLNYFKEIPINFPAQVDFVDRDLAELTVHPSQAVAMIDQKMTFLKSSHLPHDVVAKVQKVRPEAKQAVVSRFSYAQIRSERRESVRVKVVGDHDVFFRGDSFSFGGRLRDISLSGLSFVTAECPEVDEEIEGEASIAVSGSLVDVPAKLLRVLEDDDGKKYILRLNPTTRIENIIGQFIFQQQSEIIKELRTRG
ncbi:PilZ domain-containing protein [Geomesophilobacter sediminis]|uniref:PilZ domain-containing protein n=1 Tax=Geomesophilobacter sediminis TaxID=2798584 RepID=A0A8J7LX01_9BACT|nr:PilZ domain-containing protein [Geomesophilobacter sediminis]MBJ6726475.1 PilZ domain-containing protein [Geomesophilobacter sediminis]